MSPRHVRWVVGAVFAGGIAGMIVGSIADNNGTAITFGLLTVVAALCLILTTAVAGPDAFERRDHVRTRSFESEAEAIEQRMTAMVRAGADEDALRELVRDAVRLGRHSARKM